jgi:hypothetical protein
MKEIPCKGCIIQPVCTKSCNELIKYGRDIEDNTTGIGYLKYQHYLNHRRMILDRKCRKRVPQLTFSY